MSKEIIIMADIIKSSEKESTTLMKSFKNLIAKTNLEHSNDIKSPLTITLGDEFQGVLKNIKSATEIILHIEKQIIENGLTFKLRYVVVEGEISTKINKSVAYEMLGEGLTRARNRINEMKNNKNERFYFEISNKKQNELLTSIFIQYKFYLDSWKPKDYQILSLYLRGFNYRQIAKKIKKDSSVIWRKEKSLNIFNFISLNPLLDWITP